MKKILFSFTITALLVFITACDKTENPPIDPNVFTPIASFSYTETINASTVTILFSNSSQNAHTYRWDFGDYNTSTLKNPSHTYPKPGLNPKLYTVTLTAYDTVNKTKNTKSKAIEIKP